MRKELVIRVEPESLFDKQQQLSLAAKKLGISPTRITHVSLIHRALDSRRARPVYELRLVAWVDEPPTADTSFKLQLRAVHQAEPVVVVGAGPAGLFAAVRLVELGFRPVIIERGRELRERRRDIAELSRHGIVDPNSNYCFGEGGAGTFSDGKLYTRATKRGSKKRILSIFVQHGAPPDILIDSHPHIGTNKLPGVVSALSETLRQAGAELHFNERVTGISQNGANITGVETANGAVWNARAVILATGHSARDVYELLCNAGLLLERKQFAIGVRVEHPQSLIDQLQYGASPRHHNLPAASYSLCSQANGRGVYSFCMCPGGIICPASTADGEVVVNGWSPSKRNSRFANSGMVVEVTDEDVLGTHAEDVFSGLELQRQVETKAFAAGGGALKAPAQRLDCFLSGKFSPSLPVCSYHPGVVSASLGEVFPPAIFERLQQGFRAFEKRKPGFVTAEAIVVAAETRTSSPIRIPRDKEQCMNPELAGLFPCGEGAGYAGGIMSSAMDGERVADAVAKYLSQTT